MLRGVNKAERGGGSSRTRSRGGVETSRDEIKTGPNQESPSPPILPPFKPQRVEEVEEEVQESVLEKETGIPLRFQFHRSQRDN